jgi:hypothetical protein
VGVRVPALVAGLRLDEEGLVAAGDVVGGDGGQHPAGSERVGGLADPHRRVDPVEGGSLPRRRRTARRAAASLERGGNDLHLGEAGEVAAGDGGEVGAELHRDDLAAAFG